MDHYYDHELDTKVYIAESLLRSRLADIRDRVISSHGAEITRLDREWQAIRGEFEQRIEAHRIALSALIDSIGDELVGQAPDMDDHAIPEAAKADVREDVLFDSDRDYFEQLSSYRKLQGRGS
jgi:hypothetical protein